MNQEKYTEELLAILLQRISKNKRELFLRNIRFRTKHIAIVLEDIYQSQNASAVLRTADCFGIQDVHIIENEHQHNVNPQVTLGADKWLTKSRYYQNMENTFECLTRLKENGYVLVATSLSDEAFSLESLDINERTALLFGNELNGLSQEALCLADKHISIPMYGFTESYNISVAAGICLYDLNRRLRNSCIHWQLSEPEKNEILLNWCKKSIKDSHIIVEKFLNSKG